MKIKRAKIIKIQVKTKNVHHYTTLIKTNVKAVNDKIQYFFLIYVEENVTKR